MYLKGELKKRRGEVFSPIKGRCFRLQEKISSLFLGSRDLKKKKKGREDNIKSRTSRNPIHG